VGVIAKVAVPNHSAVMGIKLQQAIGANIRSARLSRGLTQEQLAEMVGCAWETVSKIERGRNPPAVKTLYDIGLALNLSVDAMMENVERNISKARLEAEAQGQEILRTLDDEYLSVAIGLLKVLDEKRKLKK